MNTFIPGSVHEVNFETFDAIVDTHQAIILDFWADWCQPCKSFAPIYAEVASLHPEIYFGKVNTEVATDLAQAFLVRSIPTVMAFKNGDLIFEQSGVPQAEQLESLISKLLAP
jgi:thioredoxin 1